MTREIEQQHPKRPRRGRFELLPTLLWLAIAWGVSGSAAASVESELAYHRGVVAFGENDLDAARSHFEVALSGNPEDASTLQFLGILASDQGQPELAIEFFQRAVTADPEDPEIRFTLGVALLHRDRAAEAALEFDRVLAVEPDNGQAEYYAGVADYRQQNFPETVLHMQSALSLDPSIRLQARYYMGLAEVFMGNLAASTAAFADAASLSPSDPLALSADLLGKKIQPESRWWGFDASTGIEYDSNPTYVGTSRIPQGFSTFTPKREGGATGVFSIDTYYDVVDWEQITVRLGYSGFLSLHSETDEVDQFTNVGWLGLGWELGDFRAGLRLDYGITKLDLSNSYRDMRRVAPSLTYTNDDWGVTQLLYQFHDFDYDKSIGGQSAFDPDGQLHIVGVSQFIYLPAPLTFARVGMAYERSTTKGTEFDYDGFELATGAGIELPRDMRAAVLLKYQYQQYDHRTIVNVSGKKREDSIYTIKLDLTVPMTPYVELALRGSFTFNDSNVDDYDFNRHVVGSYVTFTF
ncbi:MAG: tetratricopeptide repeat protein [Myxococcales bacterium]|nr:tetratricopeptide repeat protein [Myxococcales bacterium]